MSGEERRRAAGEQRAADDAAFDALEQALAHRFADRTRLELALTHPSFGRDAGVPSNERLELLGDAVLGLAVAQLLYEAHPDWREGDLTRARLQLVSEAALAREARALALGGHLRLGRSERRTGGAGKDSILADGFEALLGALYLDGGVAPVLDFVRARFAEALTTGAPVPRRDAKTALQEWAQKHHRTLPRYETLADSGVDADPDRFAIEVRVGDAVAGRGVARTKRVAEARAAEEALRTAGVAGAASAAAPAAGPEGAAGG